MHELLLPSEALARSIAAEFAAQGETILPATTPLYNLACSALDSYVHEDLAAAEDEVATDRATRLAAFDSALGDGRRGLTPQQTDEFIAAGSAAAASAAAVTAAASAAAEAAGGVAHVPASMLAAAAASTGASRGSPQNSALGSGSGGAPSGTPRLRELLCDYLETDTVCFRVDPELGGGDDAERQLRRRQDRAYTPLTDWFEAAFGVRLGIAEGLGDADHPDTAYVVAEDTADSASPWLKAVLQSLLGGTKSTVLTLALVHGRLTAADAFEAARVEEEWQIGEHGFVEDGHDTARAALRTSLASAVAFLNMLGPAHFPTPALPTLTRRDAPATVAAQAAARFARVEVRRAREVALVAQKREAMRAYRMKQASEVMGDAVAA